MKISQYPNVTQLIGADKIIIADGTGNANSHINFSDLSGQLVSQTSPPATSQSGYSPVSAGTSLKWVSSIDPNTIEIRDDFIGGTNTAGQVGQLGWTTTNIVGTPTFGYQASTLYPNQGIYRITSSAVSGVGGSMYTAGSFVQSTNSFNKNSWDSFFVFKLNNTTGIRFRLGFSSAIGNIEDSANAIWLRYDTNPVYNDTGFYYVLRNNSSNNQIPAGKPVDTSWNTLRMWSDSDTGVVKFSLNNTNTGAISKVGMLNGGKFPSMIMVADSTSAVSCDIDYFGYRAIVNRSGLY